MSWITHYLALILFAVLAVSLFSGYPVAFVLGGIAIQIDDKGKEKVVYSSGEDLLRKTPAFYEHEVEQRLNQLINKVYEFEKIHFDCQEYYPYYPWQLPGI